MKKATFVHASYEKYPSITHQGNRNSISKYLSDGYYVVEERNGFWILKKPSHVMVCLKDVNGKKHTFDMKKDIINYYGKKIISAKLVETFSNDAYSGKINFYMDDDGNYCIK